MTQTDIERPDLFKYLVRYLRGIQIPQHDIDRFALVWSKVVNGAPLPCPKCYFAGSIGRLIALPEADGHEPVRCTSCKTTFNVPMPR